MALPVLGTVVVAVPTRESIQVLIPDCTVPPVGNDVQLDLRHVVELQMGPAFDIGHKLPPPDLALSLAPNSLEPTLGIKTPHVLGGGKPASGDMAQHQQRQLPGV